MCSDFADEIAVRLHNNPIQGQNHHEEAKHKPWKVLGFSQKDTLMAMNVA